MLALDYKRRGYGIIYSSDGSVKELKNAIHIDESKELILLDDFLGQIYYSLDMDRAKELELLLSFIKGNENKCVILNSRITIYQEALRKYRGISSLLSDIPHINADELTEYEKAQIFRNYLIKYIKTETEILKYIVERERYFRILEHRNFNPRIIQSTFLLCNRELEPAVFYERLLAMLDHPHEIWKDEFENCLCPEDRIFLTTLYSLSNIEVEFELLEECFHARISNIPFMDKTVNIIEKVLGRLKKSMVNEILSHKRYVKVLNPSVNDFLKDYIKNTPLEKQAIIDSAIYFDQIKKTLYEEWGVENNELKAMLEQMFKDGTVLKYRFWDEGLKGNIYLWHCVVKEKLQDRRYKDIVVDILRTSIISRYDIYRIDSVCDYLLPLFREPLAEFYEIDKLLQDEDFVNAIIKEAGDDKNTVETVLSAMWKRMTGYLKSSYNLEAFREIAFEAWIFSFYHGIKDLDEFLNKEYSWPNYEQMMGEGYDNCHPDDIISFCEGDLSYFLEDDIRSQYEKFADRELRLEIGKPEWISKSQLEKVKLNTDILWIDQDLYKHAERAVDMAMSDLLPEQIYDEYTGTMRERSYDMSMDRQYSTDYEKQMEARSRIAELFETFV